VQSDPELWRKLQVGDRIRIVHLPCEFTSHDYTLHPETEWLYRYLIDSRTVLKIEKIDDDGYPWIEEVVVMRDGVESFEWLMVNHDGIEILTEK